MPFVASALSRALAAARSSAGARALAERRLELVDRRDQRVEQRLVAEVGVAALLDALDRGAQRGDRRPRRSARRCRQARARAQERRAPDRPRGAADALGQHDRGLLEQAAGVVVLQRVPVAQDDLEAARERVAEVAVADDRVELAEVRLVVDRRLGDRPDDQLGLAQRRRRSYSLLRRAGVRSGTPRGRRASPGRRAARRCGWRSRARARRGSPRLVTTSSGLAHVLLARCSC